MNRWSTTRSYVQHMHQLQHTNGVDIHAAGEAVQRSPHIYDVQATCAGSCALRMAVVQQAWKPSTCITTCTLCMSTTMQMRLALACLQAGDYPPDPTGLERRPSRVVGDTAVLVVVPSPYLQKKTCPPPCTYKCSSPPVSRSEGLVVNVHPLKMQSN